MQCNTSFSSETGHLNLNHDSSIAEQTSYISNILEIKSLSCLRYSLSSKADEKLKNKKHVISTFRFLCNKIKSSIRFQINYNTSHLVIHTR